MIIDFHAMCGGIPATGKEWSLAELAGWADLSGIETLVLESADAAQTPESHHEWLLGACRGSGGRFLPAATLNLASDSQSLAAARTARERGFAAAVLRGRVFEESRILHTLLADLSRVPLPVHWELTYESLDAAYRVIREYRDLSFVLAPNDPSGYEALELTHRVLTLPNVHIAIAHTLYTVGQLELACRLMGAERILLSGDMPNQHPARPLGTVHDADISESDRELILGGSALKLLTRHGIRVPASAKAPVRIKAPCSIIDTHGHVGADFRRPDFDASPEAMLRYLARGGGEKIYLSSTDAIMGDVAAGNRRVEESMRAYPGRIHGYLVINPRMGEYCLDSIRHCRERGYVGLKPYPNTFAHQLADSIMDPVWALAEEMDLPVLCHSTAADIGAVLARRPRLRIMIAHMTTEYEAKARLARKYSRAVLEISGAGTGLEDMVRAVEIAGVDKLVFGSDLNCETLGYTLYPVLCSGLSEPTLRAILRDNALRFFGA